MSKQNETIDEKLAGLYSESNKEVSEGKKPFVEPTISVPVDVLEATTFFQFAESGTSN